MNVAILGCGPAGLLSAHACMLEGITPHIISRPEKSVIPGSVYLHESIPGLTNVYPENHVQYIRLGTAEGYAKKVYGDPARNTGWEHYFQLYPSWNAVMAYDRLWERWHESIDPRMDLDFELIREIVLGHDLVISTIPAQVLCYKPKWHKFEGEQYWIRTLPVPPLDANKDIVIYNGLERDLWYRWSVLSGVCSIESTVDIWPYNSDITKGVKPRDNTCDCWPTVTRAGRWAQWRHGVLLNHAFETARAAVKELRDGRAADHARLHV